MTDCLVLDERLADIRRRQLSPPPKLTVSEWADLKRVVPNYSSEAGPWRTSRTPYLREIMDSFNEPTVNLIVVMKPSRIGATEAGLNIIGYGIDQDPSSIFIVQPTVDDAKDFSKEQLAPTLAETPCLANKVRDARSRDSGNTVQSKLFPGGALYLVGANSPRGFRRRTARIVVLEEVDGFPASAGTEGDPVKLAMRRATTYGHRRKVYANSSPTLKGFSRIEDMFNRSDQRRYHVPCPLCGVFQVLNWRRKGEDTGGWLDWKSEPGRVVYRCVACKEGIPEDAKSEMVARGEWRATASAKPGVRGYHINALYSPWIAWAELVGEWDEAQGDQLKMQVFINTALGESWEERGGGLEPGLIEGRKVAYLADVPTGVGYLTMGVDVQDDRLEYVVRGWGAGHESWLIAFERILGDTTIAFGKPGSPWSDLEKVRRREWRCDSGQTIKVFATAVDTQGHSTDAVYAYTGPRYNQRVYAIRGSSTPGAPLIPRKPTRNNKARSPLFVVGSDTAKEIVHGNLRLSEVGPGYMHLPDPVPTDWAVQVTSERKIRKQLPGGRYVSVWVLPIGARNEALDCEAYALVALRLTPLRPAELATMAEKLAVPVEGKPQNVEKPPLDPEDAPSESTVSPLPATQPTEPPARRRGFANRWRDRR